MFTNLKILTLAAAFVSGCLVYGITDAQAMSGSMFTTLVMGDAYAGCGAGSMCTSGGYICKQAKLLPFPDDSVDQVHKIQGLPIWASPFQLKNLANFSKIAAIIQLLVVDPNQWYNNF